MKKTTFILMFLFWILCSNSNNRFTGTATDVNSGSIAGVILCDGSKYLDTVTVTLLSGDTILSKRNVSVSNTTKSIETGNGEYLFDSLSGGTYSIRVEKSGFILGTENDIVLPEGVHITININVVIIINQIFNISIIDSSKHITINNYYFVNSPGKIDTISDDNFIASFPEKDTVYINAVLTGNGLTDTVVIIYIRQPDGNYASQPLPPGSLVKIYDGVTIRALGSDSSSILLPPLPQTPTIKSPSTNTSGLSPSSVSLTWYPVNSNVTYQIQVSTDSGFGSTLFVDSTIDSTKTISDLASWSTYYWRVRAINIGGTSDWSRISSFSTGDAEFHDLIDSTGGLAGLIDSFFVFFPENTITGSEIVTIKPIDNTANKMSKKIIAAVELKTTALKFNGEVAVGIHLPKKYTPGQALGVTRSDEMNTNGGIPFVNQDGSEAFAIVLDDSSTALFFTGHFSYYYLTEIDNSVTFDATIDGKAVAWKYRVDETCKQDDLFNKLSNPSYRQRRYESVIKNIVFQDENESNITMFSELSAFFNDLSVSSSINDVSINAFDAFLSQQSDISKLATHSEVLGQFAKEILSEITSQISVLAEKSGLAISAVSFLSNPVREAIQIWFFSELSFKIANERLNALRTLSSTHLTYTDFNNNNLINNDPVFLNACDSIQNYLNSGRTKNFNLILSSFQILHNELISKLSEHYSEIVSFTGNNLSGAALSDLGSSAGIFPAPIIWVGSDAATSAEEAQLRAAERVLMNTIDAYLFDIDDLVVNDYMNGKPVVSSSVDRNLLNEIIQMKYFNLYSFYYSSYRSFIGADDKFWTRSIRLMIELFEKMTHNTKRDKLAGIYIDRYSDALSYLIKIEYYSRDKYPLSLKPPLTLSIKQNGQNQIVSWSDIPDATSYKIYADINKVPDVNSDHFEEVNQPEMSYSNLIDSTLYCYRVRSCKNGTCGAASMVYSARFQKQTISIPFSPQNVNAKKNPENNEVLVSWDAVNGAETYAVYWDTTPAVSKTIKKLDSITATSYKHSGIVKGYTYYYRISAVNSAGESDLSTEVSVKIPLPVVIPNIPANVTVQYDTVRNSDLISWNAVTSAETYVIYWDTAPGVSKTGNKLTPNSATIYEHSGVLEGSTYYYRIAAVNSAGESDLSTEVSVTIPLPVVIPEIPANVTVQYDTVRNSDLISWNAVTSAESYVIYWDTAPGVSKTGNKLTPNAATTYEHSGVLEGSTYYYRIAAVNSAGESDLSTEVSVKIPLPVVIPDIPANVTVQYDTVRNSDLISWNAVTSAETYVIYWGTAPGVSKTGNKLTPNTATNYEHSGVLEGSTYYYRIAAVNSAGESDLSTEVSVTIPANTQTLFFDDFNDNVFDIQKWQLSCTNGTGSIPEEIGDSVKEENGFLKVSQDRTDWGGRVFSRVITIDTTKPIILRSRTLVHYANTYLRGSNIYVHSVNPTTDTIIATLSIAQHLNYTYSNTSVGFGRMGDTLLTPVWNQWFDEELRYNPETGMSSYILNNKDTVSFSKSAPVKPTGNKIRIELISYGWYTGHYTWFDSIKVEQ